MDEDGRATDVIVLDEQLCLFVGKKGQDVRLACHLTGWKLDRAEGSPRWRSAPRGRTRLGGGR